MAGDDVEHKSFWAKLKDCKAPWGYNEEGKFIFSGLTPKEWGQVLLAFAIFYACLIGLYIGMYFAALAVAGDSLYPIPGSEYPCESGSCDGSI